MIGISNILPFLEYARTIRTYSRTVPNEDIFVTNVEKMVIQSIGDVPEAFVRGLKPKVPTAYYVKPLGIVILKCNDYETAVYKKYYRTVFCNIVEVEYASVAAALDIEHRNEAIFARYPYVNGFLEEQITDTGLLDYALSGDELFKPKFGYGSRSILSVEAEANEISSDVPEPLMASNEPVHRETPKILYPKPLLEWEDTSDKLPMICEAVSLADFEDVSVHDAMSVASTKSAQTIRLESYFTGGYVTNRTPLLVGPSAVAKSAQVKALAKKYDMRLVDVRLAFTSRLDIEGLTGRIEKNGVIMSEASPASFMLECSDAYIDFCRDALATLSKAQEDESNADRKAMYQESIDKFREGAKIPVLFLDEVTRAPASVRQAFTKILSDKEFMGYPMTYARVIAATNSALGAPEDLQGIYQTQDVGDAAFYDRFESIQVTPEEVLTDWMAWAKREEKNGKANIHPLVMKVFEHGNTNMTYDFETLYKVYAETQNEDDVTSSPYPNYRTWELVTDYLYAREAENPDTKTYLPSIISGFVGEEAARQLEAILGIYGWGKELDSDDTLSDVIKQGMDTGAPVMMITPSSIGKSARIKNIAKERGAFLIDINLAEQDRVDLLGPPVRVPVERFVSSSISSLPEEMQVKLKETVKNYDLPSHVTIKAPKEDIITKLREASAQGREVIVHFDELNRVQNPSVMSSVFECISDHRVLGVNFDPANVRVFASCNMGENYADAQSLDPAFAARFVMYKRTNYEPSDVKAFIAYMEKNKFSPAIVSFFKSRPVDEIVQIISSVETRSLELSSASTRAWEDLDKFLKDDVNKSLCSGTVFFVDQTEAQVYQSFMNAPSDSTYASVTSLIDSKIDAWAGLNSEIKIPIRKASGVEEVTASELVNLYNSAKTVVESSVKGSSELINAYKVFKNILLYMFAVNREVTTIRTKIFTMALGPFADTFGSYYNTISGVDSIEIKIKDCKTADKFHKYVAQEIRGYNLPNEIAAKLVTVTCDYAKEFQAVTQGVAMSTILHCISQISTSEAVGEYLRGIIVDKYVENMLVTAEGGNSQFAVTVLQHAGIRVTSEQLTQAKKVVRSPRIK